MDLGCYILFYYDTTYINIDYDTLDYMYVHSYIYTTVCYNELHVISLAIASYTIHELG